MKQPLSIFDNFTNAMSAGISRRLIPVFFTAFAASAQADNYTVVPEEFISCTTCHGVELKGNSSVNAPRLNGMEAWYVRNQLQAFKKGWRGAHPADLTGMEMAPQAAVLGEERIEDAAAFVAAVPQRPSNSNTVAGNPTRGESLYTSCVPCHGAAGEGNASLNAPKLAGQSDWYLVRQLEKFKAGSRGSEQADTRGAQMRASMTLLNDKAAFNDVVSYVNTLR